MILRNFLQRCSNRLNFAVKCYSTNCTINTRNYPNISMIFPQTSHNHINIHNNDIHNNDIHKIPIIDYYDHKMPLLLHASILNEKIIIVPNYNQLNISIDTIGDDIDKDDPLKPKMELKQMKKRYRNPRAFSHLIIIRRRKMKKHKRRKFEKKYSAHLKKIYLRKEIKKEKLFRAELLAKIKEAEDFDPEAYVKNILSTIDNRPKPKTPKEKIERIRELIRKNRSETNLIAPKFEDD